MQLYPILLVAVIALADGDLSRNLLPGDGLLTLLLVMAPQLAAVVSFSLVVGLSLRGADRGERAPLVRVGRAMTAARAMILLGHAASVLLLGWLELVRDVVGDQILLDELVCLTPPVAALAGLYAAQYPVDRRLREVMYYRHVIESRPVYPMPTLGRHLWLQLRTGLLLMLVPALLIFGLVETIAAFIGPLFPDRVLPVELAKLAVVGVVFLLAPLLIRVILGLRPLGEGPIRDRLLSICRRHRFRVRGILVWETGGSMINAAVMGLVAPLRYVMMTDSMLETMPRDEVEAVMAHEIAHGVRRHMPWLAISMLASLLAAVVLSELLFIVLYLVGVIDGMPAPDGWISLTAIVAQFAAALLVLGWVSRRFERQADSFAVQHLSGVAAGKPGDDLQITDESIAVMCGALERVAAVNTQDPERRSWLHGSIRWRQRYLASIAGLPARRLPIDRIVGRIKLAALLVLVVTIAFEVVLELQIGGGADAASVATGAAP